MGILNLTNDGLPSVLIVLWRTLRRAGPQSRDTLFDLCAPETLCDRKMIGHTLRRWIDLGMFGEDAGTISLLAPFDSLPLDPPDKPLFLAFRASALDLVSAAAGRSSGSSDSTAGDFIDGICWFLAQDPFEYPLKSHTDAEALASRQGLAATLQNDTRWPGLRQWGVFFGLMEDLGPGGSTQAIPDPSRAIAARLPTLFGGATDGALLQEVFLTRLSDQIPVLDDGELRRKAERGWADRVRLPASNQLSTSLSIALLRLQEERQIEMTRESDGVARALTGRGGREISEFTSVRYLAADG